VDSLAKDTLDVFNRTGAYLNGHFRLTSGLHSPEYLQCALVLQHPALAERLGADLGRKFQEIAAGKRISLVSAPAIGGLIIGHEVARALGARFAFAERDAAANMVLRRGFEVTEGETAVVVEDVITTGGSTREVIELLRGRHVNVIAAGSIIDRSGGQADLRVKRVALATLNVVSYPEEACPMCKQGVPIQKPGSRPS
jgi:orotate phosphoribosyltransferase